MKYIHNQNVHNVKAAQKVIPFIMDLFTPSSVIDVGCGIGTWLTVFEKYNCEDILGIDGAYVDKNLLQIDKNKFYATDLEKSFNVNRKFDLAISLEVAEHLSSESADSFINSLCNCSDVILFSAAIPYQGGQNHLNEQSISYWEKIFLKNDYKLYDILRPIFWNDEEVDWWYKQNMVIFSKNTQFHEKLNSLPSFYGETLVHPILLKNRTLESDFRNNQYLYIVNGKKSISFYFKLFLDSLHHKIFKKFKNGN